MLVVLLHDAAAKGGEVALDRSEALGCVHPQLTRGCLRRGRRQADVYPRARTARLDARARILWNISPCGWSGVGRGSLGGGCPWRPARHRHARDAILVARRAHVEVADRARPPPLSHLETLAAAAVAAEGGAAIPPAVELVARITLGNRHAQSSEAHARQKSVSSADASRIGRGRCERRQKKHVRN
jgi:hypothetical protein